jgi:hypothetical protein
MEIEKMIVQVKDWIAYNLSGTMIRDIAPAVNMIQIDACLLEFVPGCEEMVIIASLADRVNVLVFCKEEEVADESGMTRLPEFLLQFPGIGVPCAANI